MSRAQQQAADPRASAFVRANAGSGKTKTLIDRTARLLLEHANPATILCVTYTKAAAAEMQRRLFGLLGEWSVMRDEPLREALARLMGREPEGFGDRDLREARKLFARALETPGGLKIQTIHAFCERLLRRFPLEAGVRPGFEVAEDAMAAALSKTARDAVALRAHAGDPEALSEAYARFAVALDARAFDAMFSAFEARRSAVAAWLTRIGGLGQAGGAIARLCGLVRIEDPGEVETRAVLPPSLDPAAWLVAARELARGSEKTDQPRGRAMQAVAEAALRGEPMVEEARKIFFTGEGERRKSLATRDVRLGAQTWLEREQDRLDAAFEQARACAVGQDTVWALSLASAYAAEYEAAKQAMGVLDFADLVEKTSLLLRDAPAAAWVLYKLDGGIDHILLDEAQDTAPDQWKIIDGLAGEFFSGAGAVERALGRSLFVVGDRKQSIYSFQGAAPDQLEAQICLHVTRIRAAGRLVHNVPLIESWRSTAEVLSFVNAVFAPAPLLAAIEGAGATVLDHQPMRDDGPGCVDLWEPEQEIPEDNRRAWDDPLDAAGVASANRRLARKIASEIKALVARGDAVFDKEAQRRRPARYGDVLILVRRRGDLFEDILRELKSLEVPVAGADRLALSAHIAFDDLLALARFALFPGDELTLAALLKSPFCDLTDDSLFDLAYGRERRALWDVLGARSNERAEWSRARRFLEGLLVTGRGCRPFDFYSRVLASLDESGRSGRRLMLERLGGEAADAIDEFLAQVLAAEQRDVRDLESVTDALSRLDIVVKREMDEARGEVRVMTAHGAKGLEAPIVFLPEATLDRAARGDAWLAVEGGGFLWCTAKARDCAASKAAREARTAREEEERLRLLYVALTRARDRLVLCGRINARADPDKVGGWYGAARAALDHASIAGGVRQVRDGGQEFRRYGADPETLAAEPVAQAPTAGAPRWLASPPPSEPSAERTLRPSAGIAAGAAPSPLARTSGMGRFRRGSLIHRLLQILPDVKPPEREAAAVRLLAREPDLTDTQRAEMAQAALGVLEDEQFAAVFAPGSRAEVAIAGPLVSGQIDRLVIDDARILVVDFKTNRPAPARIEDADLAYIRQMAAYVSVLREAFPGKAVEAALVWTDGPKLMVIPENMVAQALAELNRAP